MIFLEAANKIIQEALTKEFDPSTRTAGGIHVNGGDFDGSKFIITTKDNSLSLSVLVVGEQVFNKYGGIDLLKSTLKGLEVQSPGQTIDGQTYTFTITLDLEKEKANKDKWVKEISKCKVTYQSAVFKYCMTEHSKNNLNEVIKIPYRPDENIYVISNKGKSLVVIYSILFRDPDDVVLASGFLNEFKDAKKGGQLNSAPNVNFTQGQLPGDLADANVVKIVTEPKDEKTLTKEGWGFVQFGLMDNQLKNQDNTAELLIQFRSYLHYHLKCMKAYLHFRMRERVEKLLLNLNAAKDVSGKKKEKKTMSGRTFVEKK
ncbi:hypothetical protein ABK040_001016 [Willaertia magna]